MKITEMWAKTNSMCRPGLPMKPEYITIHETGNTSKNAGAINHGAYLQKTGVNIQKSWHYAVDDKNIVQSIPITENAWHAGDGYNGTGNRKSIAIEICVNPESNFNDAVQNAIELTVMLMRKYSIRIDHIVPHKHWSGKKCPWNILQGNPITWDEFIHRVKTEYEKTEPTNVVYTVQTGAFSNQENAVKYSKKLNEMGIQNFITKKGGKI